MGGRKTGNLAQEPPDPEMLRMSNILLRKRAVLDGGSETWKSGPGAAGPGNAPDEQYSLKKTSGSGWRAGKLEIWPRSRQIQKCSGRADRPPRWERGEGAGDFFERGLAINSGRLETAHIPYFLCVVCCMFAFLRTFTS